MGFTTSQKVSIRRYLCLPLGYYQYNTQFESMLDKIGSTPEEQSAVESILAELVIVDAAVAAAGSLSSARGAIKKVDEVEFYGPKESMVTLVDAPSRGRMLCERLADCFGGEEVGLPHGDYFGSRRSSNVTLCMG